MCGTRVGWKLEGTKEQDSVTLVIKALALHHDTKGFESWLQDTGQAV